MIRIWDPVPFWPWIRDKKFRIRDKKKKKKKTDPQHWAPFLCYITVLRMYQYNTDQNINIKKQVFRIRTLTAKKSILFTISNAVILHTTSLTKFYSVTKMSTRYNILSSFLSIQTASPFCRSGSLYLGAMHFLWQAVVSLNSLVDEILPSGKSVRLSMPTSQKS
jgi:hypothetical protein